MNIYEKLSAIQAELKAPKNQYNSYGGFNYRSCEDILENQLVELMVAHDMKKVAADDAAAEIRKVNLAEFLEKGIDK